MKKGANSPQGLRMSDQAVRKQQFILTLVPVRRPDLPDPMYRLRTALKRLLRNHGLRCTKIDVKYPNRQKGERDVG